MLVGNAMTAPPDSMSVPFSGRLVDGSKYGVGGQAAWERV
jgi:hypothetical protein